MDPNEEVQPITIEEQVAEIDQLLGEVMKRLLFVMQTVRMQITQFSPIAGADGKQVPVGTVTGSLMDFYNDANKQKELADATKTEN